MPPLLKTASYLVTLEKNITIGEVGGRVRGDVNVHEGGVGGVKWGVEGGGGGGGWGGGGGGGGGETGRGGTSCNKL